MTRLTLTFDNGPDPEVTPRVLDVLAERSVQAHFFVLGKHLTDPGRRALASRAVAEGHLVGNHSFSHETPLGEDARADSVEAEILATERLLAPLSNGSLRFRPFGRGGVLGPHLLSERAVATLVARRYTCVLWSSVPHDWDDPEGWPRRALAETAAEPHAVVVLHDIPGACLAKLGSFLDAVRDRGVAMVTELPAACTPIIDGVVVGDLDGLVTGRGGSVRARGPEVAT
jgi:peptidoglycan/xylan/chitin deacetylase (PgdA/CDA1 family)